MSLTLGQVIRGKYRIVRLLGDGGMGSVYEAAHEGLGTRVALKLIHPELARAGLGQRFLQEARAAARIKSRHVVQVADVDQTEDGLPFMVLEYIEGQTLQELYDDLTGEGRALGHVDALEYAMQMFDGVEAAHEAGVVHRDLKPDNVMITKDTRGTPLIKILDFGIAKVVDSDDARKALTRPGVVLGTPEYMAPEQAYSAATADARSDVFSLGVILFEMLAGKRPTVGDEPQQIALEYLTGEIGKLAELCPDLAPEISAAVHRAMAPLPADRFPTVRAMREAIEPCYLAMRPPRQTRPSPTGVPSTAPRPASSAHAGPPAGAPSDALPGTWVHSDRPPSAPALHAPTVSDPSLDGHPGSNAPPAPPAPQGGAKAFVPVPRTELLNVPAPSSPAASAQASQHAASAAVTTPPLQPWPYAGPPPMAAPAPPRKRRGLLLPLLLIGVVLVGGAAGIGFGVWYYYGDDESPSRPTHHPSRPHSPHNPPHQLR